MTNKVWIVSRHSFRDEWNSTEAAFLTEEEAQNYVNEKEEKFIGELVSLWEKSRKDYEIDFDEDEIKYSPEEKKFLDMTGSDPWEFSSVDSIEYEFGTYTIDWAPLYS